MLLPEDADARDAAEGASWFVGGDGVALLPSRGVSHASGLEPPPHLVGERARALDVLARGGLVCASALALAEGLPPRRRATRPSCGLPSAMNPASTVSRARSPQAGYERVERVEERGQFAVRGGIVDVFPSTGREPLRIELFGDEIEQVRAFSPFTQRALRPVSDAVVYPAAERRPTHAEPVLPETRWEESRPSSLPSDLVPPGRSTSRRRLAAATRSHASGKRRAPADRPCGGDASSIRSRAGRPSPSRHSVRRSPRGASPRRRTSSRRSSGRGSASSSSFAHRGDALRQQSLRAQGRRRSCSRPGGALPREPALRFAVVPARRGLRLARPRRRAAARHPGLPQEAAARTTLVSGRALASFADLRVGDHVVHEDHGVGKLLGFETKEVAGVTRDYLFLAFRGEDRLYVPHEQLGKLSRYIGADAKAPTLSKLGGKAWQNLKARARESIRELAGELLSLYAQRQRAEGVAFELDGEWLERLESSFPYRETEDQLRAIEAVKEDLESGRPMDRLLCGDVGFGKTEVAVRAAFAVVLNGKQVLVLCPTTILAEQHWNTFRDSLPRLPGARGDGLALPRAAGGEAGAPRLHRGQGRRARRHAPRPLARRDPRRSSVSSCSTRSSGSEWPRRSSCAPSAWRSTCSRSRPRRSRAACTCRSRVFATSRSSRRPPKAGGRSAPRSASTTRS